MDVHDLNFKSGYSGVLMTDILQAAVISKQCLANLEQHQNEGKTLRYIAKEGARVTAGVLFDSDHVVLDKDVLSKIKTKVDKRYEEAVV